MEPTKNDQSSLPFKVNQIICLEHEKTCLYGEVIQLIPSRGMCWFRPICMITLNSQGEQTVNNSNLIQLHSGSDLLWPIILFRHALDTEVISLLGNLDDDTSKLKLAQVSCRQYLNHFITQVWTANQDKF
jgi:hypothetical protein